MVHGKSWLSLLMDEARFVLTCQKVVFKLESLLPGADQVITYKIAVPKSV